MIKCLKSDVISLGDEACRGHIQSCGQTRMKEKTKREWEADREDLTMCLRHFAHIFQNRPFQNVWGVRGVSAFALFYFVRQVKPSSVFEVGVSRGFSTWLIEQAVPQAEVYCLDPIFHLDHLIDKTKFGVNYRSQTAHYLKGDFSCEDIGSMVVRTETPMVYFDDHQNCMPRLFQARAAGFKHIVFDDNSVKLPFTHRTLEHEKASPDGRAILEREILDYQVFPALWTFDFPEYGLAEVGLENFPIDDELMPIFEERRWHSYVTYLRLKD